MSSDDRVARLTRLIEARGVSGFEQEAQALVASQLPAGTDGNRDALGNLWASHGGADRSPRLLLTAHVDEIGLMVSDVLPGGFLAFSGAGNWLPGSLVSQHVEVQAGDRTVPGVIGSRSGFYAPEPGAGAASPDDLFLDVGAVDERHALDLGIRPGQPVTVVSSCYLSSDGRTLFGKALDNRVGVGVMLEAFRQAVARGRHPNMVTIASTTQEENGNRGVAVLEGSLRADVAIVFEAIATRDTPQPGSRPEGRPAQGRGPILVTHDDAMISHPELLTWALELSDTLQVPVQVARAYGVNDASRVQTFWGGVPTLVIGVPCRHIHTTIGAMRLSDYEHTVSLAASIIETLDARALERIRGVAP